MRRRCAHARHPGMKREGEPRSWGPHRPYRPGCLKPHRSVRRLSTIVISLCIAGSTPAIAQSQSRGMWIGLEGSFANLAFRCTDCSTIRLGLSDHLTGPNVGLGIGLAASGRLRFGLHASAFFANDATAGSGNTVVSILAIGAVRPSQNVPLSIRLGAGGTKYWEGASNTYRATATGAEVQIGLQYEARLGNSWLVTPFAAYSTAVTSRAIVNGVRVDEGIEPHILEVGVGLLRH